MVKMIKKGKFLKRFFCKCPNLRTWVLKYATYSHFQGWQVWSQLQEDEYIIPKDVPRGHLAVYVGDDCKRYVIKVSFLKHPLFRALLDHTEEVFGFTAGTKLCIPCNEGIFISIVNCANYEQNHMHKFSF